MVCIAPDDGSLKVLTQTVLFWFFSSEKQDEVVLLIVVETSRHAEGNSTLAK